MAAPLTDSERQRIVDLLGEGLSRKEIAQRTERGLATISRIAAANDISPDRSNEARTRAATEARAAFTAERRADAASLAQVRLEEVLDRFWDDEEEVVVLKTGFDSHVEKVSMKASARALADRAKAIQSLASTVLAISKHDVKADEGGEASMLVQLVDGLREGHGAAEPEAG